ncbi:AAA family ATPase [Nostocoides sp. F2B08]|uniref:AAA family ATPase n=1 Tax=Nostocoides sp. F2B08 TaxID=2653936 RepID=UPI0012632CC0|nr:AAA family ATPase [Tetrasphaera sp. F2B08]KAB7745267.1 AAA family ATPase [Tetrasphaera sp. F2B08]
MSTDHTRPTTLSAALAALLEVAASAGVSQDVARAEAESLAATVAEPATGAYVDWVRETGGGRTAEDFMSAASRGRRYRGAPTPTMAQLTLTRSRYAPEYARALADVAMAAVGLGAENARVLGNATTAAAAQLGQAAGPVPSTPPSVPAPGSAPDLPSAERLLTSVMNELKDVSSRIRGLRDDPAVRLPSGSAFDVGDGDSHAPGAFDLTTGTRSAPPLPTNAADGARPGDQVDPAAATDSETRTETETEAEAATATADDTEPVKTVEELLAELDELVGLTEVKAEIHRQTAVLQVERKRVEAGLRSPTITRHLVFTGNPGTGKTTVARLVGGIYRAVGLLSKGQLVEVDRSELVAGYLGQTAMKTAEVCASAKGGVLFIDEAYSLGGDQYGREAIDTLVKEMEDNRDDLVVIVAGYPVPMELFISENPGLASRFRTHIEFPDYTEDELVAIFRLMVAGADYDADADVEERLTTIVEGTPKGPQFGNARFVRNQLEAAIGRHAWRLRDVDEPTIEQLRTLVVDDFPIELTSPQGETGGPTDAVEWTASGTMETQDDVSRRDAEEKDADEEGGDG